MRQGVAYRQAHTAPFLKLESLLSKHVESNTKKRCRGATRLDVDTALFQWFTAARVQSIPISGKILKAKAV